MYPFLALRAVFLTKGCTDLANPLAQRSRRFALEPHERGLGERQPCRCAALPIRQTSRVSACLHRRWMYKNRQSTNYHLELVEVGLYELHSSGTETHKRTTVGRVPHRVDSATGCKSRLYQPKQSHREPNHRQSSCGAPAASASLGRGGARQRPPWRPRKSRPQPAARAGTEVPAPELPTKTGRKIS